MWHASTGTVPGTQHVLDKALFVVTCCERLAGKCALVGSGFSFRESRPSHPVVPAGGPGSSCGVHVRGSR